MVCFHVFTALILVSSAFDIYVYFHVYCSGSAQRADIELQVCIQYYALAQGTIVMYI